MSVRNKIYLAVVIATAAALYLTSPEGMNSGDGFAEWACGIARGFGYC
ncbi:hypothetical protein KEU06_18660 [Pseudaminobacter sp. 19-2017]|uniref:Uncharacterized protein n=1 Tax=Pseudaminobacter soli (ex Zhang et al. 2022) TaxID=2831468 RepID=A0A942E051_9HYPH|nr:hypothetical protein [Pseudaminobacter soli]MBS3650638.1 hypothetical protein [Pseudaminobacter soli]